MVPPGVSKSRINVWEERGLHFVMVLLAISLRYPFNGNGLETTRIKLSWSVGNERVSLFFKMVVICENVFPFHAI